MFCQCWWANSVIEDILNKAEEKGFEEYLKENVLKIFKPPSVMDS